MKSVHWMIGLLLLLSSNQAVSQGSIPGIDIKYQDIVKEQRAGFSTPGNEFGDQHSLYSGQLSLNNVDVSIPGNNALDVEFRRTVSLTAPQYSVFGYPPGHFDRRTRLRNWFFALPRIEASYDFLAGWSTSDPQRPKKNCSITSAIAMMPGVGTPEFYPPNYYYGLDSVFHPKRYWGPPNVIWPSGSSELLLYNSGRLTQPAAGGPFFWVTAEHSYVSCLAQLKNRSTVGEEGRFGDGEGFLVQRKDGTKYWFDWMALEQILPLASNVVASHPISGTGPTPVRMQQAKLALYATRVEDRFGNWVQYSYSNKANEMVKLDSITSNDGRSITVNYVDGVVGSVTAGASTWNYLGSIDYLQEVVNPDGSKWTYEGAIYQQVNWPFPSYGDGRCLNLDWTTYSNPDRTVAHSSTFSGFSVRNPAGAKATYRVEGVMLGRSGVNKYCTTTGFGNGGTNIQHPHHSLGDYSPALVSKKIEGSGFPAMVWSYYYQSDIRFTDYITGTTNVKVRNPANVLNIHTFGNRAGYDEGLLLEEKVLSGAAEIQRTNYEYALSDAGELHARMAGTHPFWYDNAQGALSRPLIKRTIARDGKTFVWEIPRECGPSLCLDVFGRPTKISRYTN